MRITKRNSSFLATIYTDRKETFYRLLAADSSWQQQSLNLVQRRPVKMINGETVSPLDRPILAPWTFFFRATVDNPNNDWTHIHLPGGGGRLSHINLITASVNWGEMYKKLPFHCSSTFPGWFSLQSSASSSSLPSHPLLLLRTRRSPADPTCCGWCLHASRRFALCWRWCRWLSN